MRVIKISLTLLISLVTIFAVNAQDPTVGLLYINGEPTEGYTLFTPEANNTVYLINNCGEVINQWEFNEEPGATCYLLENGTLLRAGKDSLQIRDWDNTILWTYATTDNGIRQHHDIEPLPNGNILCVVGNAFTNAEIAEEGRNPAITGDNFRIDAIVEIQPVGTNDANIVWEWKGIDHVIQDFDETKPNFGIVEDHPELIDLNYDNGQETDWTHVNAIDYNADLDQIIISPRHLNEIYIIDHSTTTEEAASHSGGNSGQGGDLLWRWGNPEVYRQAGEQKLFLQHDSKWIESGYLDGGKITVFNNLGDGTGTFSSIHIITPEIVDGVYTKENNMFKPTDFEWSWNGSILGNVVYQDKKSGTHALPNGNFMIGETGIGRVSEINKQGDVLWTYINPSGTSVINQFEIPTSNQIFRAEKYPADYIGFEGKDLTPQGIIEDQNPNSQICINPENINTTDRQKITIINPIRNGNIVFNKEINSDNIIITDLYGKTVFRNKSFKGNNLKINLQPAVYIMQININNKIETIKIVVP